MNGSALTWFSEAITGSGLVTWQQPSSARRAAPDFGEFLPLTAVAGNYVCRSTASHASALSHLSRPRAANGRTEPALLEALKALCPTHQGGITPCATMPKTSRALAALPPTPWHFQQHQATLVGPPKRGGRASKTRLLLLFTLVSRHHPAWRRLAIRLPAMAGGAWGSCTRRPYNSNRFSSHASSATFIGGGFCLLARSLP